MNGKRAVKFFTIVLGLRDSDEIIQSSSQVPCLMTQ